MRGRISNEKTHGVLTASSGQDTKADQGTTIGPEEASDPDSLRSPSRSGLPRRLRARPVAAERSHPRWRSLPQRPHERAEDHGQAPNAAGYPSPGSQVRVIETATGGRRQLRADTRSEAPRLAPAGSRAGSRNPQPFVVQRDKRTGLLQSSAAAELIHMPMTRTRHARRPP